MYIIDDGSYSFPYVLWMIKDAFLLQSPNSVNDIMTWIYENIGDHRELWLIGWCKREEDDDRSRLKVSFREEEHAVAFKIQFSEFID
jgi:hypothetical protein